MMSWDSRKEYILWQKELTVSRIHEITYLIMADRRKGTELNYSFGNKKRLYDWRQKELYRNIIL